MGSCDGDLFAPSLGFVVNVALLFTLVVAFFVVGFVAVHLLS